MKRTRRQTKELREKIAKLVEQDFTFEEIAKMLKLKSHQLASYHYREYKKKISTGID